MCATVDATCHATPIHWIFGRNVICLKLTGNAKRAVHNDERDDVMRTLHAHNSLQDITSWANKTKSKAWP